MYNSILQASRRLTATDAMYLFCVPVAWGLIVGWFQNPWLEFPIKFSLTVYWVGFLSILWIAHFSLTKITALLLSQLKPKLWVCAFVGPIIGGVFLLYPLGQYTEWGIGIFGPEVSPPGPFYYYWSPYFFTEYLQLALPGLLFWVVFNQFFIKLGQFTLFSSDSKQILKSNYPEIAESATHPDRVKQDLTAKSQSYQEFVVLTEGIDIQHISWVQAQENYIKISVNNEQQLLRFPFTKAIHALEEAGVKGSRIHRSFWVKHTEMKELSQSNGKPVITVEGKDMPVSRTYLPEVKAILNK